MEHVPDASARVPRPVPGVRIEAQPYGWLRLERRRLGVVRGALARLAGASPEMVLRLDPLGAEAWRLMDGTRSIGQVRAELAARHPEEPDVGRRLGRLVGLLASQGFLRLEDAPASQQVR